MIHIRIFIIKHNVETYKWNVSNQSFLGIEYIMKPKWILKAMCACVWCSMKIYIYSLFFLINLIKEDDVDANIVVTMIWNSDICGRCELFRATETRMKLDGLMDDKTLKGKLGLKDIARRIRSSLRSSSEWLPSIWRHTWNNKLISW